MITYWTCLEYNINFGESKEAALEHNKRIHEIPKLYERLIQVTEQNNKLLKMLLKKER